MSIRVPEELIRLEIGDVPRSDSGAVGIDLWIRLSSLDRYVRWMVAGDFLSDEKIRALSRHTDSGVYVDGSLLKREAPSEPSEPPEPAESREPVESRELPSVMAEGPSLRLSSESLEIARESAGSEESGEDFSGTRVRLSGPKAEEFSSTIRHLSSHQAEFLRESIRDRLLGIYGRLLDPKVSHEANVEALGQVSADLLETIAPDISGLMLRLKQNAKYLHIMNDTAAIAAVVVLFAAADGQTSRQVFKELTYATILMDLTLSDVSRADLDLFLLNKQSELKPEVLETILKHPMNSHELLNRRGGKTSDLVGQLVLGHHELYSGKGYPRKVRSDNLAPLVRLLSMAVDSIEIMKRSHLLGNVLSLEQAVEELLEPQTLPHLRRHSKRLVTSTLDFLRRDDLENMDLSKKERGVR